MLGGCLRLAPQGPGQRAAYHSGDPSTSTSPHLYLLQTHSWGQALKACLLDRGQAPFPLSLCAEWQAEAWWAPVRPGWLAECPSVHLDGEGCEVHPCSSAGSAANPSCPVSVGLTVCRHGWWGPAVQPLPACALLPSLCCSRSHTPGDTMLLFLTLCPLPSPPFNSPPHLHLLKNGRKKKTTVKRGMLTDKPTQLSEASMSILWMILFTS